MPVANISNASSRTSFDEGHFSRHIRRMRSVYAERRGTLIASIHKQLGTAAEMSGAEAGMHLVMMLNGVADREIAARAARQRPAEEIPGGVRRLGECLA